MFGVIYKLLPDVKLYRGRSTVASVYRAVGSLIVILLWVYYSAQIVFFGFEFTTVHSRRFETTALAPVPP